MLIFKDKKIEIDSSKLSELLKNFDLAGKKVLVYSRVLSIGRICGEAAVEEIISQLQQCIGPSGILAFPTYTFSTYKEEIYDPDESPSKVGIIGEASRKMPGFRRTIHPIYSHTVFGSEKEAEHLLQSSPYTCFGNESFFERFHNLNDSVILMLGTNLSACTYYHHFDYLCKAPGRYRKVFNGEMRINGEKSDVAFDSLVKDREFYKDRMNCLGYVEYFSHKYGLLQRQTFGRDIIEAVSCNDFYTAYKACSETDPINLLHSAVEDWQTFYEKNKHNHFEKFVTDELEEKIKKILA